MLVIWALTRDGPERGCAVTGAGFGAGFDVGIAGTSENEALAREETGEEGPERPRGSAQTCISSGLQLLLSSARVFRRLDLLPGRETAGVGTGSVISHHPGISTVGLHGFLRTPRATGGGGGVRGGVEPTYSDAAYPAPDRASPDPK